MERSVAEIEWIITKHIYGELIDDSIKVWDLEGHECVVTFHNEPGSNHGVVRFDGRYVDVGDDLPVFLGVLDEIAETGISFPDPEEVE